MRLRMMGMMEKEIKVVNLSDVTSELDCKNLKKNCDENSM